MSLYKEIAPLFEYLNQIRKLENYIVFDMIFPKTWKIPKKFIIEDKFLNNGSTEDSLLLSFISEYDESEINKNQQNILGIINYNLEREAKEKLLESKISELRNIFEKEPLDALKILKFELKSEKPVKNVNTKSNTERVGGPEIVED
jgi:hypothetical protein